MSCFRGRAMGKNKKRQDTGAAYYVAGKKRPIARSTPATLHFLALAHLEHPTRTINQLRCLITDKTQYIPNPEAVEVLDVHIKRGYGNNVPTWRYPCYGQKQTATNPLPQVKNRTL